MKDEEIVEGVLEAIETQVVMEAEMLEEMEVEEGVLGADLRQEVEDIEEEEGEVLVL